MKNLVAIDKALSEMGMRRTNGCGWYVIVMVNGEPTKVWADEVITVNTEGYYERPHQTTSNQNSFGE